MVTRHRILLVAVITTTTKQAVCHQPTRRQNCIQNSERTNFGIAEREHAAQTDNMRLRNTYPPVFAAGWHRRPLTRTIGCSGSGHEMIAFSARSRLSRGQ